MRSVWPDLSFEFINAGLTGNSVETGLDRIDAEVISLDPAVVVVAFGMNDGGYLSTVDPVRLDNYITHLGRALDRLTQETDARIVVLSPSFFDWQTRVDHALDQDDHLARYNDVLLEFSAAAQPLVEARGLKYVDINRPMEALTVERRRFDPRFSFTRDGIHFTEEGGEAVGRIILRALVDAGTQTEIFVDSCLPGEVAHSIVLPRYPYLPTILLPWTPDTRLDGVPFPQPLNVVSLRCGRADEAVSIRIDGTQVGVFQPDTLLAGIQLASLGPWNAGTATIDRLAEARRDFIHRHIRDVITPIKDIDDPDERARRYEAATAELADERLRAQALSEVIGELLGPMHIFLEIVPAAPER